jgi:hypothetical protein
MGQLPNNYRILNVSIADISTASSAWVVSPCDGYIKEIYSVIDAAITTADGVITAKIATVAVTGGAITVTQSGSAAGDVDVVYPTALNYVTKGQAIEFAASGACDTTCVGRITVVIAD